MTLSVLGIGADMTHWEAMAAARMMIVLAMAKVAGYVYVGSPAQAKTQGER